MLFFQSTLAFFALSASATLVPVRRDVGPAIATLLAITDELNMIDFDLQAFNKSSNASVAFAIDGKFNSVHVVTVDASLQVLACTAQNGVADTDDTELFIRVARATYVPTILDVLNNTILDRPIFAEDELPDLDLVATIRRDLIRYNGSNSAYLGNLTRATPPGSLPLVKEITKNITMAFNEAIAAYSPPMTSSSTPVSPPTSTAASSSTSISSSTPVSPPTTTGAPGFGQCGGQGWNGPFTCVSGFTCTVANPFFSQCLPS
ncbi:hypothetical protein C8R47DRAFT_1321931 [Mycena vitilis]|nr:hypothetical protein C8R47DRAFT_1321931 [Mycena vitilis]